MRAAYPYIDDFLPAGTVAIARAARRDPGRRPGGRHAPRAARRPPTPRCPGRSGRPSTRCRASSAVRPSTRPHRGRCDEGAARHPRHLAGGRHAGADVGRAVVVRTFGSAPRPEGAVLLYATDGRIAGSVSGGCVEGAAAEEIERARRDRPRPGHPLRDQRRAGVGRRAWPAAARSTCSSSRSRPAVVIDAARGSIGAGGHGSAVITPLPADSPPGEFGPHQPGDGRAARRRSWSSTDDGRLTGTLGTPELDAALVEAAAGGAPARPVADRRARRPLAVHRGLPGPAAARRRRRRRGRALARAPGPRARLRDGRRRRPRGVRDAGALPRRRPARRRLAGRGRRRDRPGPERRRRGPVPRRQVRRAGDRRGAAPRLPLRRRGRLAQDAGATGARGCSRPA